MPPRQLVLRPFPPFVGLAEIDGQIQPAQQQQIDERCEDEGDVAQNFEYTSDNARTGYLPVAQLLTNDQVFAQGELPGVFET